VGFSKYTSFRNYRILIHNYGKVNILAIYMAEVTKRSFQKQREPLQKLVDDQMIKLGIETYRDFADHFEIGRSTVYEILRGRTEERGIYAKPSVSTLIAFSKALDKPLHELIYYFIPDAPGAIEWADGYSTADVKGIPIYIAGWVGAGPEREVLEGEDAIFLPTSFAKGRDLVAFEVHGDSMSAGAHPIYHLDVVVIDKNDKGQDGSRVVARLDSGYVCKLLKVDRFGKNLYSANPNYSNGTPPHIPADRVQEIVGKVVKVLSSDPEDPTLKMKRNNLSKAA
jgi:repressor LexA